MGLMTCSELLEGDAAPLSMTIALWMRLCKIYFDFSCSGSLRFGRACSIKCLGIMYRIACLSQVASLRVACATLCVFYACLHKDSHGTIQCLAGVHCKAASICQGVPAAKQL